MLPDSFFRLFFRARCPADPAPSADVEALVSKLTEEILKQLKS